mmetsp:Transcript_59792/g.154022  ORF Transcript_59792/g.154022 Transcript_59792/m.154022 type:complete len:216 (+) Transcript_59792:106-753(+)
MLSDRLDACAMTSLMASAMIVRMSASIRSKLPRPWMMDARMFSLSLALEAPHSSTRTFSIRSAIAKAMSTELHDSWPRMPAAVLNVNGRCNCFVSSSSNRHQTRYSDCTSVSSTMSTSRTRPPRSTLAKALSMTESPRTDATSHWLLENEHTQYTSSRQSGPATNFAWRRIVSTKSANSACQQCETKWLTMPPPHMRANDTFFSCVMGRMILAQT